ncbi:MAG TPA: ZIP family metal transporter [Gammaproteobacteria bacterium]|nr:ZIP family metal transporter [Gammaproteobacteria bacterium]
MGVLGWIILFSLLGGVLSVVAAGTFLLLPSLWRERLLPYLISFATGALLGAAFLALLPHAMGAPGVDDVHDVHDLMLAVLLGVLAFFVLEKMVLWRHCHHRHCEAHDPTESGSQGEASAGVIVLVGDSLHNFVDGIIIAAAFLSDSHLGMVTALAVAAHEIPQEVGDFAVLLSSGFSRGRAMGFNLLSSLATVVGAVLAYYGLQDAQQLVPYALAVAAASFIYVAVADLIPGLHERVELSASLQQIGLISAGVLTVYLAHSTLH